MFFANYNREACRKRGGFHKAPDLAQTVYWIYVEKLAKLVYISDFIFTSNFKPSSPDTRVVYLLVLLRHMLRVASIKTFTCEQFLVGYAMIVL